ncbi:hypothetical protein NX059_004912 [Plenodomus lindquistii]|nr:hypothetical protein NX059_004912 [Plenodomus lindquistii]
MPSHLTRLVFRTITANEPLLYRGCCHRAPRPRTLTQHGARPLPRSQQRTFLDFLKPRRRLKKADMPTGLNEMAEVTHAFDTSVRPPPPREIAAAFRSFFAQNRQYDDFHMVHAYNAFQYLLQNPKDDGSPWISRQELDKDIFGSMMLDSRQPEVIGTAHLKFGRLLLAELERLLQAEAEQAQGESPPRRDLPDNTYVQIKRVRLLSWFGAATEARDIVAREFPYDPDAPHSQQAPVKTMWNNVIGGVIKEQNLDEILQTTDLLQTLSIPVTYTMQNKLVNFFCETKDVERAKFWYSYPIWKEQGDADAQQPRLYRRVRATSALLRACARSGDRTYGQTLVTSLLETEMGAKESWDAVYLWSAAIGKGPDEIDRMMSVQIRRNDEARQKNPQVELIRPDVETMNTLVEFCMSKNDPYGAERYISIGEKRGILPNEKTFAMQMEYRISVGDLDGARAAYFNLQGDFSGAEHSVAVINELIRAMCVSNLHHFDDLMAMVDDLHERKAKFDPETVAALTLLHLRRGEIADAMDLLQVHAYQYSPEKRKIIRKALSLFILDRETSTSDAWDGYQILRNVFIETPKADRIAIMKDFFSRKRSDMACHVFFHMRNHMADDLRADRDVYTAAFTGYARCADAESLELTHNQLRLDLSIDMDTKLRNALMLAYACTEQNLKALQFWREICESKEGPTYNSIVIAFRACEGMHWGAEHAKSIWKRLKEQDVDIDKPIWTAYMCAIARNHEHAEAMALVESVEEEYGFTPDLSILGNWYNLTPSNEKQKHVEAWIKKRFPEVWQEMEALGYWITFDGFGYRQYNITREFEP